MDKQFFLTGITSLAERKEADARNQAILKSGLFILNSVSIFLVAVCVVFFLAFIGDTDKQDLALFFLCEAVGFALIPVLGRKGYERTAKFLFILYIDVGIVILNQSLGSQYFVSAFFIPAIGLSILLFNNDEIRLRNISIIITVISLFVLEFVLSNGPSSIEVDSPDFFLQIGVLAAAAVTTWLVFNTFSESKDKAEQRTAELLVIEKELNKELEKNVEQLQLTSVELEKTARAKSDFLATMSHEIRTPMNAILGMTNLLMQDDPREDQVEQIEILDFSAKTLLALINDILDFSKIEAGKVEFEKIEFKMDRLVTTIVETFKLTASKKGIELKAKYGRGVPKEVIGDPARLTQILNNLLSNALKFTKKGSVELNIKLLKEGEENNRLQIAVKDTGIGIEQDRVDSIFESFTQENTNTQRLYGGTGLGLTISKELTELQGGKIWVESKVGKGSTFFVELDFGKAKQTEASNKDEQLAAEETSLDGIKVLLVEDNIVNQKVMQRYLERWNISLFMADDGKQAIEMLKKQNFDIVLMDLQMPVMDGYEAASIIRKMDDPVKRDIPIIALTAAALKEVKEQVYAVGMNDYITKPFNPAELQDMFDKYVNV